MNEEESIFGTEPDRLMRLMRSGLEADESEAEASTRETAPAESLTEQPGTRIGHYKLLRVLGEGGMGIVYLAEQQGSIRRRVALKVIKPGMDSKRVLARFEAERQALALLDHPNIAQVYDAGTTESGRPYFVMEYVKGSPITEYCDQHRFTIENRLHLFLQVCHAAHHAHQKGIIHRDIKPSNILVTTHDDQAIPKMIDFGVAKAVIQPLTERTLVTEQGQLFGTPEYMSPEQADMANEDIDTRSDIYSLGVLLYVLLTGVLPFDSTTFREGGIEHIRQVIRETDPKTPSTRLSSLGEEAKKVAQSRRTEVATLAKKLHKELEWIPLKAMRKERAERYRSASEFADDIENYIKGAPLLAGPLSTVYRLKKFTRRNRVLVTGIAAILIVLIAGVVGIAIFAVKAERARAGAQASTDFFQNGIEALTLPGQVKGTEVSLHDLLAVWSEKLEGRFDDKPLIEARICSVLGWAYRYIYELRAAELHLERTLRIYQEQLGPAHPKTLTSMDLLAFLLGDQGRYAQAAELVETALSISRRALGDKHDITLSLVNTLGCTYIELGLYDKAEQLFLTGLRIDRRAPWMAVNLGRVYQAQGRYEEAESQHVEWFRLHDRSLDDEDSQAALHRSFLASVYIDQKQYPEAKESFLEILPIQRRELGNQHWHTLRSANWLARVHTRLSEYSQADSLLKEVLDARKNKLRKDHPSMLETINDLGVLRREQKRYEEAKSFLKQALEGRRRELRDDHPATLESKNDLAVLYKMQGDYAKAEPLFLEAFKGRSLKLGDTHIHTLESWNNLIDLYEAWGKPEKAEEWRAKLPQTKVVGQ